ncbi:MAG: hypothetical protein IT306_24975 [Chloroflexi bacterium]|nr:hypothetical protein [Chloroflexota bacterium]
MDEDDVRMMNASTNGWKTLTTWEHAQTFEDAFVARSNSIADWLDGSIETFRGESWV